MKIIGIIGSRRRDSSEDLSLIIDKLKEVIEPGDCFISGGCPKGGDKFAEDIANSLRMGIVVIHEGFLPDKYSSNILFIHPADWDKYGKRAGFIRNTYIARDADILIALVSEDRTGGTEDTIKKFEKRNKKAIII